MRAVGVQRDTLRARDIDEGLVMVPVRRGSDTANGFQLFFRVLQAFVAARYVVVYLNAVNAGGLCLAHDLLCIIERQRIGGDSHLRQPASRRPIETLLRRRLRYRCLTLHCTRHCTQNSHHGPRAISMHGAPFTHKWNILRGAKTGNARQTAYGAACSPLLSNSRCRRPDLDSRTQERQIAVYW